MTKEFISISICYVLPKQAHLKRKTTRFEQGRRRQPKCFIKIWNLVKTTRISRKQNSTVQLQKCETLHDFACHPCAGAMLIFSVTFQRRRRGGRVVNQKCVLSKSEHHKDINTKQHSAAAKMWKASRFCVSSLRRGHGNLLCIVLILVYVLPTQSHIKRKTARFEQGRRRQPKCFIKIWNLVKTTRISRKTAQCSYKNVKRFTILRVILAQGPC